MITYQVHIILCIYNIMIKCIYNIMITTYHLVTYHLVKHLVWFAICDCEL